MSLLASLSTDTTIADEQDSLGKQLLDSGVYDCVVKYAYITEASSGALGLNLTLTVNKQEVKQVLWMTSGLAKGRKNYFEKDGNKTYLPGFLLANSLSLLTLDKEIGSLDHEAKIIKLWDNESKSVKPTSVNMVVDLLDQKIKAGIIKQIVDKTAKADDGSFVPTGETREENEVVKFFRESDGKTTAEIKANVDGEFIKQWASKFNGVVKNRSSGTKKATQASKTASKSLFD